MIRLSETDRFGALPTPVRSSGTWATPALIASRGGRLLTTSPPIRIVPLQRRRPVITSASSVWPLPATAAMPDDLARADVERHAAKGRQPAVALGRDVVAASSTAPGANGVFS